MKKVCFFSGDITRGGGTERVASLIANALASQRNYEILFLSLVEQQKQPFFVLDPKIRRYALGDRWISPGPGYLPVIPKLRRFLKEKEIDVLIDIDIVLDILSIPAAKGGKTKVLSWGHFSYYFEQKSLYRRWILRYAAKRADYMVTINEENRSCIAKFLKREKDIATIYNPVQEPVREPAVPKEKWILSVGRLVAVKGIDDLAETAVRVLKEHSDWKWIVVGDGEERPVLETAIAAHHLEEQLILKGTVSDVEPYLQRAQIFVLTSRSEGLPMCLLEAKANGLPCVSFDIHSGPNEIIEDQVNGYLVPPYDCAQMAERIGTLIQDEALRRQFAENTVRGIRKFQMDTIIQNWNGVLEYLCGCRKQ
jgi:glycosyltransferase involved in cell wall biosynthesis